MSKCNIKILDFDNNKITNEPVENKFEYSSSLNTNVSMLVRNHLANKRISYARVKDMSEISGTTAKPHNQKGTGRARQGSKRSVQFVGGRTCHGPQTRDFSYTLPKKLVLKTLKEVINYKLKTNNLYLFKELTSKKTADANKVINENKISNTLFVIDKSTEEYKYLRNIKHVKVTNFSSLSVYDIIKYDNIAFSNSLSDSLKNKFL